MGTVFKLSVLYKVTGFDSPPLPRKGKSHGAVLWMEYHLAADISVSTGLLQISNEKVFFQSNLLCPSLWDYSAEKWVSVARARFV